MGKRKNKTSRTNNRTTTSKNTKTKSRKKNKFKPTNQTALVRKKDVKMKFKYKHPKIALALKIFFIMFIILFVIAAGVIIGLFSGALGSDDFSIDITELVLNDNSIKSIRKDILSYLSSNQKVYVVCPSIEKSNIDISNVMEIYEKLKKELSPYNVGLLHGKMTALEKEKIMKDFDNGYYQVLVSTTVIEVGINILDANMMIIYNAERFGLASIHQLRGRIARDGKIGYCYLLSDSEDIDAINRLEFISSTNDGFKISEYDLKRRGAGDMLGVAQSGKSPFMVANLIDDFNILKVASEDAKMILNNESKYQEYLTHIRQIIHSNEQFVD